MQTIINYIDDNQRFREDEETFNQFIHNLDINSFIEFLIQINKKLRRIDDSRDTDIFSEGVIAGELVAATKTVRENILNQLLDYLKQTNNYHEAAVLTYYIIINLHMFSDGNGRTARFIYDLFNKSIDSENYMYYFHKENDSHYPEKAPFEETRKILDLGEVNWMCNSFLETEFKPILDAHEELKDKKIECGFGGFYANRQERIINFIKDNFNLNLTESELSELAQILSDNGGVQYTPSGIGMMYVALEKGQLNEFIKTNQKMIESFAQDDNIYRTISHRMNFSLKNNIDLLKTWTSDDFRKVINIGNKVKQKQLEHLIGIFKNPDDYSYEDNTKLKDYLVDSKSVKSDSKKSL